MRGRTSFFKDMRTIVILKDQFQLSKTSSPGHQKPIRGKVTSQIDFPSFESFLSKDRWGSLSVQDGERIRVDGQDFVVRANGDQTVLEAV